MPNIIPTPEWSDVYQIETADEVLGGADGVANAQAIALANRTEFLAQEKAGIDYVQSIISVASEGTIPFKTEAELLADIPSQAKVLAKALDTRKEWLWIRASAEGVEPIVGVWEDMGLSDVELAREYTDSAFDKLGVQYLNLLHDVKKTASNYVDYTDGSIESVQNASATDFIKIKPDTVYKTSSIYYQQFAFYDANKAYISGLPRPDDSSKTFLSPVNAAYARFTIPNEQVENLIIAELGLFDYVKTSQSGEFKSDTLLLDVKQITDFDSALSQKFGLRSLNIFDKTKVDAGNYIDFTNGSLVANSSFSASDFCEVFENKEYKTSSIYYQQFAFYDANKAYISGLPRPDDSSKTFLSPVNAAYARFTIPNEQVETLVISESEMFPSEYVSHAIKIADNIITKSAGGGSSGQEIGKPIEIWVSPNLTDNTAFKGKNAVQQAISSINDATSVKSYIVKAKQGIYKVTKGSDFIGYLGYPSMIDMKDYVNLEGQGEHNTIIWAELPYDDAAIGVSADGATYPRNSYQTIYNKAKEVTIKNLTFVAKNLRYTLHQDNPLGSNTKRYYENVSFIYLGNKGSLNSMGIGTWSGEETYVSGGSSITDSGYPIACHSNTDFKNPSGWFFNGHNFASYGQKEAIVLQNSGSLVQDKFQLVGCSFGGKSYVIYYYTAWLTSNTSKNYDSFNHAGWHVYGHSNEPFLFENAVNGLSLRVKTASTGVNSSVRFDVNSSAYPVLIKNNHGNTDANIFIDSREYVDGYIVQDGSVGLSAQAWGCRDLAEYASPYDSGVNYTSLATRLGDCSSTNKTLEIIINGTVNTVTFNKDYSGMTNAQILSEMNSQISGAVIDTYAYGRDYYPAITDVCETVYNTGDTYIPKGSVVTKSSGSVRLANGSDRIFGIALDDILVVQITSEGVKKGQGRVMKRGYIYADRSKAHFVLADNYNPAIGTRFNVINGQLVTDLNGKISTDIDAGVISINC